MGSPNFEEPQTARPSPFAPARAGSTTPPPQLAPEPGPGCLAQPLIDDMATPQGVIAPELLQSLLVWPGLISCAANNFALRALLLVLGGRKRMAAKTRRLQEGPDQLASPNQPAPPVEGCAHQGARL